MGDCINLEDFFKQYEHSLLSKFEESKLVHHDGDRGEEREDFLRMFLEQNLPRKFGVTKGQVLTQHGLHSHSADIIIYDALNSPVLYKGKTDILPVEGVYGIIEVKSRLSKSELLKAISQVEKFKQLAPRELSVVETREYVTVHRPSRPFGIVFAYDLENNSMESLAQNYIEENERINDVKYMTNLICVLKNGLLYHEKVDLESGIISPLLDTDEFVNLILTRKKREQNGEKQLDIINRIRLTEESELSFGKFYTFLLIMLSRIKLSVPDLSRYLDPDLPIMVSKES